MRDADFLIVGGGIAGASAAYRLAPHGRTIILEAESQPGYHTSGRSAALYSKRYRNPSIRGFAIASGAFLEAPPDGFAAAPLLTPRGLLIIGRADQQAAVANQFTADQVRDSVAHEVSRQDALALVPCLNPDYVAHAMLAPDAQDIDTHGLHQGFLKGARRRKAEVVTDARVLKLDYRDGKWRAETAAGIFTAPVVVNAAGAWADAVAAAAGLGGLGIQPLRRTCLTFDAPAGTDPAPWPMTMDADEAFYFKPEAGRIMASPCDEHPSPPVDAQPEDLDVAEGVDRVERATTLAVRRVTHRWAGLRCFMRDRLPVVGADPRARGFIWLAGLGGFGMMTSEALGRAAAAAALGAGLPDDIQATGVDAAKVAPDRFLD